MSEEYRLTDQIIREAIEEELKRTPEPPLSRAETWENIRTELNKENSRSHAPRKRRRAKGIIAAGVFAAILLGLSLSPIHRGYAYNWINRIFTKVQEDTATFTVSSFGPDQDISDPSKPPLPSPDDIRIETPEQWDEQLSLNEAREKTIFAIRVPQDIPEGYSLEYVQLHVIEGKKSNRIHLYYQNQDREIRIGETRYEGKFSVSSNFNTSNAEVSKVQIDGEEGELLVYEDGSSMLLWYKGNMEYFIEGDLSGEEMMKLAKSM